MSIGNCPSAMKGNNECSTLENYEKGKLKMKKNLIREQMRKNLVVFGDDLGFQINTETLGFCLKAKAITEDEYHELRKFSREIYSAFPIKSGEEIFLCDECMHSDDNPYRLCDWEECGKCGKCGKCFRSETRTFYTYPPVFNDDETENEDYDSQATVFTVRRDWYEDWCRIVGENPEEFMKNYTYDDTIQMLDCAISDGALTYRNVVEA